MAGRRAARRCVTVVIPYVLVLVFVNHLRLVVITHEQQDEGIAQETFNLAVRDNGKLATPSKPITNETRPLIPVSQVGISSYNTTKTPKSRDGKGQRPAEDCSRLKPAYGTETQTFQPFHDQGHVFSAHHDTRDNTIKVIALGNHHSGKWYCQLWYRTDSQPEIASTSNIRLPENHKRPIFGYQFSCRYRGPEVPYAVSIVSSGCEPPKNVLYVSQNKPSKTQKGITVCTTPLFYHYNDTSQLVELIEVNRLHGVDHIVFYNLSIGASVDRYLRHYMSTGVVDVIQWHLPRGNSADSYDGVYYFAQVAAYTDCLLRTVGRSAYIVFTDVDEILVPRSHGTLPELITKYENIRKACSLGFRNAFFRTEWSSISEFAEKDKALKYKINILLKTRRESKIWSGGSRSKYLARVSVLVVPGIHTPYMCSGVIRMQTLPIAHGLLHHYRSWGGSNVQPGAVKDEFMLKLAPQIVDSVSNVHATLGWLD